MADQPADRKITLFSYVVRFDTGFAPNPFWGHCTLATCKPGIRKQAKPGDWVVGTGSRRTVGQRKIIYAMRVDEVLPLDEYWSDPRFSRKRPTPIGTAKEREGDNIYSLRADGEWDQAPNARHNEGDKYHDLRGENALISRHFWYWGSHAVPLPECLERIIKQGPGFKRRFDSAIITKVIDWLEIQERRRRYGNPSQGNIVGCECHS